MVTFGLRGGQQLRPIKASTLHILKVEIDPKSLPVVGSLVVSIFVRDTLDPGSTPPRRIIC